MYKHELPTHSAMGHKCDLVLAPCSEGITGTDDYSPVLAVAGFVAVWFNKLSVDRVKLLQALAVLQLFVTAVNLITNRGVGDKVRAGQTCLSRRCALWQRGLAV